MELGMRELPGYPGVTIRLEWNFTDDSTTVIVSDIHGETVLHNNGDRARAKDCYFHPFAYGYVYPKTQMEGE